MPRVSIILPVRNAAAFLDDCIRAILAQTFEDFELIVLDDSTDQSPDIVRSFKDERIRLVNGAATAGRSLVETLNLGIELSSANYIARIDADDICLPERLRCQTAFLDQNPRIGLVSSNIIFVSADKKPLRVTHQPSEHSAIVRKLALGRNPIYHPTVLVRRDILEAFGGYRTAFRRAEDFDLWLRMIDHVEFHILKEPLLLLRLHADQVSGGEAPLFFVILALADYYRVRGGKPSLVNPMGDWDKNQYAKAHEYYQKELLPRMALADALRRSLRFKDLSHLGKNLTPRAALIFLRRSRYVKQHFMKFPDDLRPIIDLP